MCKRAHNIPSDVWRCFPRDQASATACLSGTCVLSLLPKLLLTTPQTGDLDSRMGRVSSHAAQTIARPAKHIMKLSHHLQYFIKQGFHVVFCVLNQFINCFTSRIQQRNSTVCSANAACGNAPTCFFLADGQLDGGPAVCSSPQTEFLQCHAIHKCTRARVPSTLVLPTRSTNTFTSASATRTPRHLWP
jgi:hypothetical protein